MLRYPGESTQAKLIYKGAEAEVYLETWLGSFAVRKHRVPKPYRIEEVDRSIRRSRVVREATILSQVKRLGVPAPAVYHVDLESCTIVMEFIQGPTFKAELPRLRVKEAAEKFSKVGGYLALMHRGGIVHGDVNLSNLLLDSGRPVLIDFGLSNFSDEMEDRAVDLLLLNRSLKSTYHLAWRRFFEALMDGYAGVEGSRQTRRLMDKMREVESRGRYFERA